MRKPSEGVSSAPDCKSAFFERRAKLLVSLRLLLFPILSGVTFAYSYPPDGIQLLAWVALVPLGLALCDRHNWPELYVGLYLGGLAFHLIHLDWILRSRR